MCYKITVGTIFKICQNMPNVIFIVFNKAENNQITTVT